MAFAVGELGLRLEEFYDMPFCEFLIKSYAFNRMQKERLRHTRLIAWSAQIGSHLHPNSVPKSIEQFIPIDEKRTRRKGISDEMKALAQKRMDEYNEAMRLHNLKQKKLNNN